MEIPSILKYIFLLHFIVAMIFGVWFFLGVEIYGDLVGWPWMDPVSGRIMGSMLIGYGVASILGYRATSYEEVKILVIAEIVWCLFALISQLWMIIVYPTIPLAGWLNVALFGIFFVLFLYVYYTTK